MKESYELKQKLEAEVAAHAETKRKLHELQEQVLASGLDPVVAAGGEAVADLDVAPEVDEPKSKLRSRARS